MPRVKGVKGECAGCKQGERHEHRRFGAAHERANADHRRAKQRERGGGRRAQLMRPPPDRHEAASHLVLVCSVGNKEAVRHKPRADGDSAVDHEQPHGGDWPAREIPGAARQRDGGDVASPRGKQRGPDRGRDHGPGLISGPGRKKHRDPEPPRDVVNVGDYPLVGPEHGHERDRQHQRLCHGRRLQVEEIRVERQQRRGRSRAERRPGDDEHEPRGGVRRDPEARDRQERPERAGPIEKVDLRGKKLDQVGQRQPDGPELLPPRRDVIDHAPGDDEVGSRVVVAEDESRAQEHDPCDEAGSRGGGRERAGYNHGESENSLVAGLLGSQPSHPATQLPQ